MTDHLPNLTAIIVNCTLKRSPEESNTAALIDKVTAEYERLGVGCETLRIVDYNVLPGTSSNQGDGDEWPTILDKIRGADILVVASPVWVGHLASTAQRLIERMDAVFHEEQLQDPSTGQYFSYNKVAGALVTGNEDGAHSCVAQILWAMQEFGFTVPPNSNAYWVGEAGPGPSYREAGGAKSVFTNKTYRYMVHNTTFMAGLLKRFPIDTNLKGLGELAEQESK